MRNVYNARYILLLSVALLASTFSRATDAVLNIDGIVRVKELPFSGTRMVMMEHEGPVEIVDRGLDRFYRSLPLGSTFLLAFERAGCVTKQLYFDTNIPAEALAFAPFSFPFKVTLEPPGGREFEYAGPVGYIRYYPERQDFGYDTDYTKIAHPVLIDRMMSFKSELKAPKMTSAPEPSVVTSTGPSTPVEQSVEVPVVEGITTREVAIPASTSSPSERAPASVEVAYVAPVLPKEEVKMPEPKPEVTSMAAAPEPIAVAEEHHKPVPVIKPKPVRSTAAITAPRIDPVPITLSTDTTRSEELIVEKLRVTKVIRFETGAQVTEYRKVQHLYGAVFYFKNGESCSEQTYQHEALAN